jgi:predicted outer membrane repeat protein
LVISHNYAYNAGGGIQITSESQSGISTIAYQGSLDSYFEFSNCLISNNTADFGGGIYVDSSTYSLPGFGEGSLILANQASQFGGGVYIGTVSTGQTFMFDVSFEKYVKNMIGFTQAAFE